MTDDLAFRLVCEAESVVTERYLRRIAQHIADHMERELRVGGPPQPPTSEQMAQGIIKGMAAELSTASQSLFRAAEALKNSGKGFQASQAHQAAIRAQRAAEDLVGG